MAGKRSPEWYLSDSNQLSITAMRFITGSKSTWTDLVLLGVGLHPRQFDVAAKRLAEQIGSSAPTIKTKFLAIKHQIETGHTIDQIIAQGQKATIAGYVNGKVKARTAPLVPFPHKLTPEVRDAFAELYLRLGKLLKLKTYDEVTDFIISKFAVPDEDILHDAGEGRAPEKTK